MKDGKQFYHSGDPIFDAVCRIRAKTAGEPMTQALQQLINAGFRSEVNNVVEWLTEQDRSLKNVCSECCGDCLNCGIMTVVIEIKGALKAR